MRETGFGSLKLWDAGMLSDQSKPFIRLSVLIDHAWFDTNSRCWAKEKKKDKKGGQKSCGMLKNTCSQLSASKQVEW